MNGQSSTFEKDVLTFINKWAPVRNVDQPSFDVQKYNERLIHEFLDPTQKRSQSNSFDETLERILHASMIITRTDSGFISLRNLNNKIEFKLGRNTQNQELGVKDFVIQRSVIRQSIQQEEPIHQNFAATADPHPVVKKLNLLVAPMFLYSDLIGLVYLQSYQPVLEKTSIKAHAFTIFLKHASLAIRNFQYNKLRDEFEAEKDRLQKSLIESDNLAMKGRMAAKVGHEINNFLSGINANIEMAADLVETKGKRAHIIERLEKAQEMIMNLSSLSNSLMSKSGLQANVEKSSLNQVVDKFVDFVKPIYKCSHVVIEKEQERLLPQVDIDSGMMIQVLFNLVKNAVEAKPDARILLKTYYEKNSRQVFLEIHDNGPGIPESKHEKIFTPLFTENKAHGHGYGLAICRDIVEKHDGTIQVKSKPGDGTTFIISLPFKVGDDYAQVEFDSLEQLEVKRARNLKNSIKAKRKRTITNPPYRPISNYTKIYGLK